MGRVIAIVGSLGVLAAVGLGAQQPASPVAGKWDVTVDRQPTRTLQLTVDGTAVAGTLTKAGATAPKPTASRWCGPWWDTASAVRCTKTRRSPISVRRTRDR